MPKLILAAVLVLGLPGCGPGEAEPALDSPPVSTFEAVPTPVTAEEPEPDMVEERWRLTGERPGQLRVDVALPKLRDDLPGAEEVNGKIEEDYSVVLDRELEEYDLSEMAYGDPDLHIWYEVYSFGSVYEICIRGEESALSGSGPLWWTNTYCYDADAGAAVETEGLLEQLGYTPQDVVDAFYKEVVMEDDPEQYTYEQIRNWYYIKEAGEFVFTVSLYA